MKIIVSPKAERQLRKLPRFDQIAITKKLSLLFSFTGNEEKLAGFSHTYRVRVGNYRIVYKKISESIYIFLIAHRRDVYKIVKELIG